MTNVLAWAGAYLLGSIPMGLFWGWVLSSVDVREHGSGRTGGGNVWRAAGFLPAFLTALSDALKGGLAVSLAHALGLGPWATALSGALSVVGHNYSLFMGFHGGAGTMTSLGAAIALWWVSFWILVPIGLAVALLVGHSSAASTLIALLLPLVFALSGRLAHAVAFGLPAMALSLWSLRPNIRRLLRGEERFLPMYRERRPPLPLRSHPNDE